MYKIIALIGEAGTGKDTLMKKVLEKSPKFFNEIISYTTRPLREGEADGVNYFYLSLEEFFKKMANNELMEATCFNNWFYGTGYLSLNENLVNIGVFNPNGIRSLLKLPDIDLTVYRISCDDKTRLLRQLNREKTPVVDEIIRRYTTDKTDFNELEFSYIEIPNNTLEDLINGTQKIIEGVKD